MTDVVSAARAFYAEEIRVVARLQSTTLVSALATVPREQFLGPGPWDLATADPRRPGSVIYTPTADADPRHVYHNVLVAIDRARELNNGHPATLATWLDLLNLQPGETFVHAGCGTGYYTALAATMVGASGRVVAIEIDVALAERATRHLGAWPQAEVTRGDAAVWMPPACDGILVNAGFTHPLPQWLDALKERGRLLVPITAGTAGSPITSGAIFLVTRQADRWRATSLTPTAIFGSPTGRVDDLNAAVRQGFAAGTCLRVKSVRRDAHAREDSCWVHAAGACLSLRELD